MKNISKYFIIIAIFCVNLIGLLKMIFSISEFFVIHLFAFFVFFISAIIISCYLYKNRMAAWIMLLLFFAAYLIDITFLYLYSQNQLLFVLLILTSVIGFLLSIDNIRGKRIIDYERRIIHESKELEKAEERLEEVNEDKILEYRNEILREAEELAKAEVKIKEEISYRKDEADKAEARITKKPKKKIQIYVSSRKGEKYHVPNCRWAKKILPKRKLTFESREQAESEGLKPCECVK
ncbi:MAG: hypothetical protein PHV16_01990 [Candidatus Nanoarchaeia archaeon]|nr:hypothetical protein [Candidatus Nanoarchaeia archaeon]